MITIKINEWDLLDILMERVKYWTTDGEVLSLYESYLDDLIESGCISDIELDVMVFIDNLYINDTLIMTSKELRENNIDVENGRVLYSQDDLYLVQAY